MMLAVLQSTSLFSAMTTLQNCQRERLCAFEDSKHWIPRTLRAADVAFLYSNNQIGLSGDTSNRLNRLRFSVCSDLRGGSQLNPWPEQQESGIAQDGLRRDKDSEMVVHEPPSPQQDTITLQDSNPIARSDDKGQEEPANYNPETGIRQGASDQNPEIEPSLQDARSRRDNELKLLFQSGHCRREDIDDRCMQFIYDIDPESAAEVALHPRSAS